jgi:hypothetical protein
VIKIDDSAKVKFAEIVEHAVNYGLLTQLLSKLEYITNYGTGEGCLWDRTRGGDSLCTFYPDFAPLSLTFVVKGKDPDTGKWEPVMSGGFIYQGPLPERGEQRLDGSAPALCVSLVPGTGWNFHT